MPKRLLIKRADSFCRVSCLQLGHLRVARSIIMIIANVKIRMKVKNAIIAMMDAVSASSYSSVSPVSSSLPSRIERIAFMPATIPES